MKTGSLLRELEPSLDQSDYSKRISNYDAEKDTAFYNIHQMLLHTYLC